MTEMDSFYSIRKLVQLLERKYQLNNIEAKVHHPITDKLSIVLSNTQQGTNTENVDENNKAPIAFLEAFGAISEKKPAAEGVGSKSVIQFDIELVDGINAGLELIADPIPKTPLPYQPRC